MKETTSSDGAWKTIRISRPAYHKLLELSSLMTLVSLARPHPLSVIAEWAINTLYDAKYPKLKDSLSDPNRRIEIGKEIVPGLKKVYDSRDEWKATWETLLKAEKEAKKR